MVGWLDGWMLDVGWLEKAELKPTQPSLAGAWLSLAILIFGHKEYLVESQLVKSVGQKHFLVYKILDHQDLSFQRNGNGFAHPAPHPPCHESFVFSNQRTFSQGR